MKNITLLCFLVVCCASLIFAQLQQSPAVSLPISVRRRAPKPIRKVKPNFCCPKGTHHWTSWKDWDNPNGLFDIELIWGRRVCGCRYQNPIAIDAEFARGGGWSPWWNSGNWLYYFDHVNGLLCINSGQRCKDFRVRFCCPRRCPPWNPTHIRNVNK